jgi:hypothetical protein
MTDKTIAFLISGDIEITQVMIDAGNKTAELIHTADCISSLDGLGGGPKKADAPADVAQYFGRPEGSSTLLVFQAMDELSSNPFGIPTKEMLKVGLDILAMQVDAAFLKGIMKNHPQTDVSEVHPDTLLLARDTRSPLTIMYNAMIMSTREEPEPEKTAVRIHYEEARAMNIASLVVTGVPAAQALSAKLVVESAFFSCTPLPDDQYEFSVKADRAAVLAACPDETKVQQVIAQLQRLHPEMVFTPFPLGDYDQYAEIDAPDVLVSFEAEDLGEGLVDPFSTMLGEACEPSRWGLSVEAAQIIQRYNRIFITKYPNCDGPKFKAKN